jgi:hypothetical protein
LDVFDELEKNILIVSVPGENDNSNDLFIFYFNDNISNFTITHSKKPLNQEAKLIIGTLLFNSVSIIVDLARNVKTTLNSFKGNVSHIIETMKSAKSTIDSFHEKHEEMMMNFANQTVSELSESFGSFTFELSRNAIHKIKEFNGDLASLKDALKNAMFFASSLCVDEGHQKIVIDDFHLNFVPNKIPEKKQITNPSVNRQTKTLYFLDRLEEAANLVLKQKKSLTGTNVGKAFEKPISAPAISDALKNHRKTIKDLMFDNPQRWPLIRSEFRPLINILTIRLADDNNYSKQA